RLHAALVRSRKHQPHALPFRLLGKQSECLQKQFRALLLRQTPEKENDLLFFRDSQPVTEAPSLWPRGSCLDPISAQRYLLARTASAHQSITLLLRRRDNCARAFEQSPPEQ